MTQPAFYPAYTVVGVLAYGAVFYGLYTISTLGVWLGEKTIYSTTGIFISAGLNIVLNMLLIPVWGIMGASVATVIAYMAGNILVFYFSEKYYHIGFDYFRLGAVTLVTCLGIALQLALLNTDLPAYIQYSSIFAIWVASGLFFIFVIVGKSRIRTVRTEIEKYLHKKNEV